MRSRQLFLLAVLAAAFSVLLYSAFATVSSQRQYYAPVDVSAPRKPVRVHLFETPVLELGRGRCGVQDTNVSRWFRLVASKDALTTRTVLRISNVEMLRKYLKSMHVVVVSAESRELLGEMSLEKPEMAIVLGKGEWLPLANGDMQLDVAAQIYYEPKSCDRNVSLPILVSLVDMEAGTIYFKQEGQAPAGGEEGAATTSTTVPQESSTTTTTTTTTSGQAPVNETTTTTTTTARPQPPPCSKLALPENTIPEEKRARIVLDRKEMAIVCGHCSHCCRVEASCTLYLVLEEALGNTPPEPDEVAVKLLGAGVDRGGVRELKLELYRLNGDGPYTLILRGDNEETVPLEIEDIVKVEDKGKHYWAIALTAKINATIREGPPSQLTITLSYEPS